MKSAFKMNHILLEDKDSSVHKKKITTILIILALSGGIGFFTIPAMAMKVGLFTTYVLVALISMSSIYSTFLLSRLYSYYNIQNYPKLVREIIGKGFIFKASIYLILIRNFFQITLIIFFGFMFSKGILQNFKKKIYPFDEDFETTFGIFAKSLIALMGFLMSLSPMKFWRYLGYTGFIGILSLVIGLYFQKL